MKRFLLVAAAMLCGLAASAQWTKPTIERMCDLVVDDTVYLYNTGAKMFFNQGNEWTTHASLADEGLMMRLMQYRPSTVDGEGNEVAGEWDGKTYMLEDYRPIPGGWFYVFIDSDNSGYNNYGGCYVDRVSQADYLWELDSNEDGTYRLVGAEANPKYHRSSYANCYAGAVCVDGVLDTHIYPLVDLNELADGCEYFMDWAFVAKGVYADYAAKIQVYHAAMTLGASIEDCQQRGLETAELEKVYANTSSTLEEILAAQKVANGLISQDDEKNVTPDHPQDFSARIVNADFAEGKTGWECEYTGPQKSDVPKVDSWVPATEEEVMVSPAVSVWLAGETSHLWQVVEGIPNGIYEVSAGIFSQSTGPVFYANDARVTVPTCNPTKYTLLTYVQDNTMEVGITSPAEGVQWYMADCFRLKYFGNGFEAYKMWIDNTLSSADSYEGVACYQPLYADYSTALSTLTSASTQEELVNNLPIFLVLYDSLKVNVAAYTAYEALVAEAVKMAEGGAYVGDEFDALCDYVVMETDPTDEFPNGTASYILKNGSLNTEAIVAETEVLQGLIRSAIDNCMAVGADATAKIQNPNFDEGFTGWTYNKKLGAPAPGGMTDNPNVERWNQNFDFYQVVELPNGVYRVDAQAFYRTASNTVADAEWTSGETEVLTWLYANTGEVLVKNVYAEAQEAGFYLEDNAYTMQSGSVVPNSMKTASEAFSAGLYENTVVGVVWDGTLRVGIRSLNASASDRWSIWDNFRLTFMGYDAEAIYDCYQKTLAEAEDVLNGDLTDELQAALVQATEVTVDTSDGRGMLECIAAIRAAMNAASDYVTSVGSLAKVKSPSVTGIYTPNGLRVASLQKGINFVRMGDGSTRKILVR
ncbi:MAG: hypothetical protein IJP82_06245 [Bacteroidaceae bacterium]|nr:hypothetical protein [Bacteroidaceae bacterium]